MVQTYRKQQDTEQPQREMKDDLLTIGEVADILRVDGTTVRRWIKQGSLEAIVLPHVNTRQAYRVRRSTMATMLQPTTLQPHAPHDPTDGAY